MVTQRQVRVILRLLNKPFSGVSVYGCVLQPTLIVLVVFPCGGVPADPLLYGRPADTPAEMWWYGAATHDAERIGRFLRELGGFCAGHLPEWTLEVYT